MINPKDYPIINNMQPGQSYKVKHKGCTVSRNSNSLKITYKPEGLWFYCFACKEKHMQQDECSLLSHRKKIQAQYLAYIQMKQSGSLELPKDFSRTIHADGLLWLAQGGWGPKLIDENNVGYSRELGRVIFPLTKGWLGRAVHEGQSPKYWQVGGQEYVRYTNMSYMGAIHNLLGNRSIGTYSMGQYKDEVVCIVEDILSAGRVGQFMTCDALLGTTADAKRYMDTDLVLIWLDPDKAGITGATQIAKDLQWYTKVEFVKSTKDPKNLTNKELQDKLREVLMKYV